MCLTGGRISKRFNIVSNKLLNSAEASYFNDLSYSGAQGSVQREATGKVVAAALLFTRP
jgi:hypothetical protein